MAMDWDRSGEGAGAVRLGIATGMAWSAGEGISNNGQLDAFSSWLAHADAGRIAVR